MLETLAASLEKRLGSKKTTARWFMLASWERRPNFFLENIPQKILQIPLAEEEHGDFQVWRGEHSGQFTVRSAYKLLQ